jgi:polar amino acid transport system substrate-binding protein
MIESRSGAICGAAIAMFLGLSAAARAEPISMLTLDYPPYAFEENGLAKGIAVDLVIEALKRTGRSASVTVVPWARALDSAKNGDADGIVVAGKSPEREQILDYCRETLLEQSIVLFAQADSSLTFDGNLESIASLPIGVVSSVSYGAKFDAAVKNTTFQKLDPVSHSDLNARKLLGGRIDLMISNRYVGLWSLKKIDGLAKVKELSPPVEQILSYTAFSKKRDLGAVRDAFDAALKGMKADGSFAKIVAAYVQ